MKPRKPAHPTRWKSRGRVPSVPGGQVYRHRHLQVISSFDGGEWHVSVTSLRMGTVSNVDLALVCAEFGMHGAVEENVRGPRTRHLWLTSALELAS